MGCGYWGAKRRRSANPGQPAFNGVQLPPDLEGCLWGPAHQLPGLSGRVCPQWQPARPVQLPDCRVPQALALLAAESERKAKTYNQVRSCARFHGHTASSGLPAQCATPQPVVAEGGSHVQVDPWSESIQQPAPAIHLNDGGVQ